MDGAARLRFLEALQVFLQAVRRLRTWEETDQLLKLLRGIADPELRLRRFAEHLKARAPEVAAWTIAQVWDRVAVGDRRTQETCQGLLDSQRLSRVVGTQHLGAVQAVLERDRDPSAELFRSVRSRPDLRDEETRPGLKDPVGFRVSLARRPVPIVLDRLLFDPDARVVRTVLGNPRLTEAEVVKLAASRRLAPEVLEVIAQDDRWSAQYRVKEALANNPTTPLRVVLGLLPYLLHQDLRAVATGSSRPEVRERAAHILSQRSGV